MLRYEHPLSSYAQKVKIVLRGKGLDSTAGLPKTIGTGRRDGPLAQADPRAAVPVLADGAVTLSGSRVIRADIEETGAGSGPPAAERPAGSPVGPPSTGDTR
jgi:glutathione S-transferase